MSGLELTAFVGGVLAWVASIVVAIRAMRKVRRSWEMVEAVDLLADRDKL